MNDKLKYAPGKPGFGSKGVKGIDGLQGLSMYFTNFEGIDPINDPRIVDRIINNTDLWILGNLPLPDGRLYVTGDLFIDAEGKVYEINSETDTYEYKYANINLGGFFVPLGASSSEGYARYFNSNIGQKYIIDNVHTASGSVDYTSSPEDIYGIPPINFTRIEFTNIKQVGDINAFTTYTIGSTNYKDALAIVYEEASSNFRIGNVDNLGVIRDTNLIFDVSSMIITKQYGINTFTPNTPDGAILTNHEINANSLFDSNFEGAPPSFNGVTNMNDCEISWNLSDFTNDSSVQGELHFYEKVLAFNGNTYRLDASIVKPLVFSNVEPVGTISINGLCNTDQHPYEFYMKLFKNGWSRNSEYGTIFSGTLSVEPVYAPMSRDACVGPGFGFDVNSNILWYPPTLITNPDSAMSIISYTTGLGISGCDGSIFVGAEENTGRPRLGVMRIYPYAGHYLDVSIIQQGDITDVTAGAFLITNTITSDGTSYKKQIVVYDISLYNLPLTTTVDVITSIDFNAANFQVPGGSVENPYVSLVIRTKTGTLLSTSAWTSESNELNPGAILSTKHKYAQSISTPYSSFPLRFTLESNVDWVTSPIPGGQGQADIKATINVNYNSGPQIYVIGAPLITEVDVEFYPNPA